MIALSGIRASMVAELSEQAAAWPLTIRSTGNTRPMTPVDPMNICCEGTPMCRASTRGGFLCGSQSLGAGTGIGVTAIDENGSADSLAQMQTIDE